MAEYTFTALRTNDPLETEPVPQDWLCMNRVSGTDQDAADAIKDPRKPMLIITQTVYREITYLAVKNKHTEYAGMLVIKPFMGSSNRWIAYDWFMPKQHASAGAVDLLADDTQRLVKQLGEAVPKYAECGHVHRHVAHFHSHGTFQCSWSSVDDEQQLGKDDIGGYDDFRFYLLINGSGMVKATVVSYVPCVHREMDIPVFVYDGDGYDDNYRIKLTSKRKAELDEIFREQIVPRTPGVGYGIARSEFPVQAGAGIAANPSYTYPSWAGMGIRRDTSYTNPHASDYKLPAVTQKDALAGKEQEVKQEAAKKCTVHDKWDTVHDEWDTVHDEWDTVQDNVIGDDLTLYEKAMLNDLPTPDRETIREYLQGEGFGFDTESVIAGYLLHRDVAEEQFIGMLRRNNSGMPACVNDVDEGEADAAAMNTENAGSTAKGAF